jgi:hypothetical protein
MNTMTLEIDYIFEDEAGVTSYLEYMKNYDFVGSFKLKLSEIRDSNESLFCNLLKENFISSKNFLQFKI